MPSSSNFPWIYGRGQLVRGCQRFCGFAAAKVNRAKVNWTRVNWTKVNWLEAKRLSIIKSRFRVRVIGGQYRGRRLRAVEGFEVRPTSDRLRETLFNILAPRMRASRFLDICAGSGAVGIEALSRGASEATFIDNSRRACSVIEANLQTLGIKREATLIKSDAIAALKRLAEESKQFDIIFLDPPYDSEIYSAALKQIAASGLLSSDAIAIAERRAKKPPETDCGGLKIYREVKQGDSALAFYRLDDD
jgi:16S rRNA (guanine966-N2)-methyltransferase